MFCVEKVVFLQKMRWQFLAKEKQTMVSFVKKKKSFRLISIVLLAKAWSNKKSYPTSRLATTKCIALSTLSTMFITKRKGGTVHCFFKRFNNLLEREKSKNKSNTVLTIVDVLQNVFFFFVRTFLKSTSKSERAQGGNNFEYLFWLTVLDKKFLPKFTMIVSAKMWLINFESKK